eukprot:scpid111063/ scgid27508/ 
MTDCRTYQCSDCGRSTAWDVCMAHQNRTLPDPGPDGVGCVTKTLLVHRDWQDPRSETVEPGTPSMAWIIGWTSSYSIMHSLFAAPSSVRCVTKVPQHHSCTPRCDVAGWEHDSSLHG